MWLCRLCGRVLSGLAGRTLAEKQMDDVVESGLVSCLVCVHCRLGEGASQMANWLWCVGVLVCVSVNLSGTLVGLGRECGWCQSV